MKVKLCSIKGCGKKLHAHGFCSAHATKFIRYGDPLAGRTRCRNGEPLLWIERHADYDGNDCLPWPFERTHYGYGTVKHEGKRRPASRVMCIIVHGKPPTPKHEAAHSCGNGHLGCMNPKHIRWKTKIENIRETLEHGTNVRGEKCHFSKLKETDIKTIRRLARRLTGKEIAKIYGVKGPAITRIIQRQRWAWVE